MPDGSRSAASINSGALAIHRSRDIDADRSRAMAGSAIVVWSRRA
jgi:hypothetical protein